VFIANLFSAQAYLAGAGADRIRDSGARFVCAFNALLQVND